MNLVETVDAVLSGNLGPDEAEALIRAASGHYDWDAAPGMDALLRVDDARLQLARDVRTLFARLESAASTETVSAIGRLVVAASAILGEHQTGSAWLAWGVALKRLHDAKGAHVALVKACELLDRGTAESDASQLGNLLTALAENALLLADQQSAQAGSLMGRALSLARGQQDRALLAWVLASASELQEALGATAEALALQREALAVRSTVSDEDGARRGVGLVPALQLTLARRARDAGHVEEAMQAFEAALAGYTKPGQEYARAIAMSELAELWSGLDRERGRAWYERAAALAEAAGHRDTAERWRRQMGTSQCPAVLDQGDLSAHELMSQGQAALEASPPNLELARAILVSAVNQAKKQDRPDLEADVRVLLGRVFSQLARFDEAVASLRVAVRILEKRHEQLKLLHARLLLVECLVRIPERAEAEAVIRKAIIDGEALRDAAATLEFREAAAASLAVAYGLIGYFLLRPWLPEGSGQPDELLVLGQRARASNLMARIGMERNATVAGDAALAQVQRKLRQIEVELQVAADRGLGTAPLFHEHGEARANLQRLVDGRTPDLTGATGWTPLAATEIAGLLKPREALLDAFTFTGGVIFTLISHDGQTRCAGVPWSHQERLSFLDDWMTFVGAPAGSVRARRGVIRDPVRTSQRPAEQALLARLSHVTTVVEGLLGSDEAIGRLFFVPHRELFALPPWALVRQHPLLAVSVLPTATMLRFRDGRPVADGRRLAIADWTATLSWCQAEVAALDGYEKLEPSTVTELLSALSSSTTFHFAGHGVFHPEDPYGSGLVLGPGARESETLDTVETVGGVPHRVLTTARLMSQLRMEKAELVVLSGCCTGLPRAHAASEFTGLPAAFFVAGARNVVASLWPVDDGGTYLLMEHFYRALKEGRSTSAALVLARGEVASISRERARARLGYRYELPELPFPFAGAEHSYAFQHFGFD